MYKGQDKNVEKRKSKLNIKLTGSILLVSSIALLTFLLLLDNIFKPTNYICTTLIELGINITYIAISIGIGTILYGYFDFINFVKRSLVEIVIDYDFTQMLSNEKLANIVKKLEKQLIYPNNYESENTLYDYVNNEVVSLVKIPYYESVLLNVSCYYKDDLMYKDIKKKYVWNFKSGTEF